MKIQPINYKYHEVEVPQLVIDMFSKSTCTAECPDRQEPTLDCFKEVYHDCLRDFISDNIGYLLEEAQDKLTIKGWAMFLMEWYKADKANGGHFVSHFVDTPIDNKTYRSIWFGWTRDLEAGSTGYLLMYEITNHG